MTFAGVSPLSRPSSVNSPHEPMSITKPFLNDSTKSPPKDMRKGSKGSKRAAGEARIALEIPRALIVQVDPAWSFEPKPLDI